MKKLKLSLIAIALIFGGVKAFGGLRFTTYYCIPGIDPSTSYYTVAANSPAVGCLGGMALTYVCTFTTTGAFNPGQQIASTNCSVLSTYQD